jgi:predicted transcriptional regulator
MAISKALQNLPKAGFLVRKYVPSGNPGRELHFAGKKRRAI